MVRRKEEMGLVREDRRDMHVGGEVKLSRRRFVEDGVRLASFLVEKKKFVTKATHSD